MRGNPVASMTEHLDSLVLDELRAVLGEDFAVLVSTFVTDSDKRLSALRAAAAAADAGKLREAAHSFKGSALNMGARQLSALCRDVEARARSGEVAGIDSLVDEIAAETRLVSGLLAAMRKS